MFDIGLVRRSGTSLLRLTGEVRGPDDSDLLCESFAFVQPEDHLVLDLTDIHSIDARGAIMLWSLLEPRVVSSGNVIVSPHDCVSRELARYDIDRFSPIVSRVDEAMAILDDPMSAPKREGETSACALLAARL